MPITVVSAEPIDGQRAYALGSLAKERPRAFATAATGRRRRCV